MSRIPTLPSIEAAPMAAQPMLSTIQKQMGSVPNVFRVLANSPAALEGYLGLNGAISKGTLGPKMRERIYLAIAQFNECSYCLSAHSYFAKNMAKLDDAEIAANRKGTSSDPKADAAVRFAVKVAGERGHVDDDDIKEVKAAGYTDGEIVEIVVAVATITLTDYINEVAKTEIDFPAIDESKAA